MFVCVGNLSSEIELRSAKDCVDIRSGSLATFSCMGLPPVVSMYADVNCTDVCMYVCMYVCMH